MEWISLIIAGLCEVFGVAMFNKFNQEKKIQTLILIVTGFGCSFLFLSYAMNSLPMGLTYAIWTGIGASGGSLVGMYMYGESTSWKRISCIALIILSVIGLKLTA